MATLKGIWVFNDTLSYESVQDTFNFTSNGKAYTSLIVSVFDWADYTRHVCYKGTLEDDAYSFDGMSWTNTAYKTIEITSEPTDEAFITWLTANATQQASEEEDSTSGVTVEYDGSVVATIPSGNKATIPVADKKMKTDIVITVPKAEGGTDSAIPTEVSTEDDMTALLTSGEIGGVYKYTGPTGTYENGALYLLEEENSFMFELTGTTTYSDKYNFDSGMTWQEFIASNYNTAGPYNTGPSSAQGKSFYGDSLSEQNTPVYFAGPSGGISVYLNGVQVMEFDLVQNGATYTSTTSTAGGGN